MWEFVPCSGCLSINEGRVLVIDVMCTVLAVQVAMRRPAGRRLAARSEKEEAWPGGAGEGVYIL